jgi:hypothetical protein
MAALEPRVLLAADASQAVESAVRVSCETTLPSCDANLVVPGNGPLGNHDGSQMTTVADIVFIDSRVDDISMLTANLHEDAEFVLIDSESDAIKRISQHLSIRHGIRSVHLVSHAMAGELILGSQRVDIAHLELNKRLISNWSTSLLPSADIVVYGCEAGHGSRGESFVRRLATLSGADVAASIDRTGNGSQADWEFELHVGPIESTVLFSALTQQKYCGTLSLVGDHKSGIAESLTQEPTSLALNDETGRPIDDEGLDSRLLNELLDSDLPVDEGDMLPAIASMASFDQKFIDVVTALPLVEEIPLPANQADVELPLEDADLALELEPLVIAPQQDLVQGSTVGLTEQALSTQPSATQPTLVQTPPVAEASVLMNNRPNPQTNSELVRPMSLVRTADARQDARSLLRPLIGSIGQSSGSRVSGSRIESESISSARQSTFTELPPSIAEASPSPDGESESRSKTVRVSGAVAKPERVSSSTLRRIGVINAGLSPDLVLGGESDPSTIETATVMSVLPGGVHQDELGHSKLPERGREIFQGAASEGASSSRSGAYNAWAAKNALNSDHSDSPSKFADVVPPLYYAASTQPYAASVDRIVATKFAPVHTLGFPEGIKLLGQLESQSGTRHLDSDRSSALLSHENTLPIAITIHSVGMDTPSSDSVNARQSTAQVYDTTLDASAELLEAFAHPTRLVCHTGGSDVNASELTLSYLNPLNPYQAEY